MQRARQHFGGGRDWHPREVRVARLWHELSILEQCRWVRVVLIDTNGVRRIVYARHGRWDRQDSNASDLMESRYLIGSGRSVW